MRLFYLSICVCALFACKKGNSEFTIKGTITDATFQQGLSGATLSLYQIPSGSITPALIGTTTVGSDGSYSFKFEREKMDKYILVGSKNNYFDINETIYFSSLTISSDNVRNYSTTAKSWVRLHFYNASPVSGDELQYIKQAGKESCAECCPKTYQYLEGAIDTAIYCINDGNTTYSYYYTVTGTSNQGIKSVTTVPFDTTELYLSY